MKLVLKLLLLFVLASGVIAASAQARQLGTWRVYLPYNKVNAVYDAGDKTYCITPYSFFSYEKNTGVVQTYDKSNGLSDVGVQVSNYDPATKFLVLAYANNNLDFIYNGTDIYNISDIKQYAGAGAITIYGISFYNGNAYISSTLGISIISLTQLQINETFTIGTNGGQANVYATTIDGTNIYAATDSGVKYAPLNSPTLQDFNSWHILSGTHNLPAKKIGYVQAYNHYVYAVISSSNVFSSSNPVSDSLYRYDGATWAPMAFDSAGEINYVSQLSVTNGSLYLSAWGLSPQSFGLECKMDTTNIFSPHYTSQHSNPGGWFDNGNTFWEGDVYNGLYINRNGNIEHVVPDGPYTRDAYAISAKNGVLNVCTGGINDIFGYSQDGNGFGIYEAGKWNNRNQYTDNVLNQYYNIVSSATVSSRNKTYFGSFYAGVLEYDNSTGSINNYDNTNTNGALGFDENDGGKIKVSCMTVDQYDNLWMDNGGAVKEIAELQADGTTWKSYQMNPSPSIVGHIAALKKMIVDENNQLWAPARGGGSGNNGGLLVWNTTDATGMGANMLNSSNAGLPNDGVNCVAEDKSGNIWAGTIQGIGIFYCPSGVLTSNGCSAQQIKVTLNGVVGYLFGTENVQALAVDAANRIWVGTTNGIWLISNDGQTTYQNFNISNSPMLANQVTDIAIDNTTGEVFIGTINGLVSYQGDAMETCVDCKEALVFPNPVTPEYTGPIAIKGLTENAYVKITDVTGTLIYQGKANGTQMIWDGKGYDGIRAKSGVYLVFSSNNSGKARKVAKILLTN